MRIIVGIDNSAGSRAALRYAMREAASHGSELIVVHAWEPAFDTVYPTDATRTMRAAAQRDATQLVETMVAQARAQVPRPVERFIARAVQGEAAGVLTGMARETDLVIVGSNRRGIVRRLLLGSVSSRVVQESDAPVVVVPAPQRHRPERRPHARAIAGRRPLRSASATDVVPPSAHHPPRTPRGDRGLLRAQKGRHPNELISHARVAGHDGAPTESRSSARLQHG